MWLKEIIFDGGAIITLAAIFGGIPYSIWQSVEITTKELNKQCGTNYTQREVFFAEDTLTELCHIKNQNFTIEQK